MPFTFNNLAGSNSTAIMGIINLSPDSFYSRSIPLSISDIFNLAKKMSAVTVGISAFDGGMMKELVDFSLHVPTEKGEYGPAEDAHMMLDHLVSSYLIHYVKDQLK